MKSNPIILLFLIAVYATSLVAQTAQSYRNEALRLTFTLPDGWAMLDQDKSTGERNKVLLRLSDISNPKRTITLGAEDASGNPAIYSMSPDEVFPAIKKLMSSVAVPITDKPDRTEYIGGQRFARSDFRAKENNELWAVMLAIVRGNLLKATIVGKTQDELDEGVQVIVRSTNFDPDWSAPVVDASGPITRVRVSQKVSDTLIKKQVPPSYPSDARHSRIEGSVVMHAVIGTDGKVKAIWVLRGDPLFSPTSVAALRQWEYKPYVLNGVPVEVDTQVTISYKLH